MRKRPDWNDVYEYYNWPEWPTFHRIFGPVTHRLNIRAGQNRNGSCTLENMQAAMKKNGVSKSIVLPVFPHTTTDEVLKAQQVDDRVVPFTGPDFSPNAADHTARFRDEVAAGVRGLKLHPILTRVGLDSPENFAVVEAFAPHNLPVLFHSGYSFYYATEETRKNERPEHGEIPPIVPLLEAFPNVTFILGHAGLGQVEELIELCAKFPNAIVEPSFQPPHRIRQLLHAFGPERVIFGSDWPWGSMESAIRCMELACGNDEGLKRQIFYENAQALIGK